jgi:hypothetical protein
VEHIADWQADLAAQGHMAKHAAHTANRVRRLVAVMIGSPTALIDHRQLKPSERGTVARTIATAIAFARLSDLTRPKIQMGSFLENAAKDLDSRLAFAWGVKEAPPGFEPGMKGLQTSGQNDLNPDDAKTSHLINDRLSLNLPLREKIPADLAEIVDAWTDLPDAIKAGVLAMVRATGKRRD